MEIEENKKKMLRTATGNSHQICLPNREQVTLQHKLEL
jgi:hypothetical protein